MGSKLRESLQILALVNRIECNRSTGNLKTTVGKDR